MGMMHGARALLANGPWVEAHEALTRLARQRAGLDAEEGRWLLQALRSAAHEFLGFGSFCQYVEHIFGYKPRTTQEKLRVAEALEGLPQLARALDAGRLSWCATRELTRVAVPETEQAWLDTARGKTQRELETLVASSSPGDLPGAGRNETPRPRVLRFEVAPDTFATFREATRQLERTAGARLDDDALLLAMARHILGGPHDTGRSSYQISLDVCSACGRGVQLAGGERVPVDAAIVAMAACDAQHLGELLPIVAALSADEADRGSREGAGTSTGDTSATARQCPDHAHMGVDPLHVGSDHVRVGSASQLANDAPARAVADPTPADEAERSSREHASESTGDTSVTARQCSDHAHVSADPVHSGRAASQPANDAPARAAAATPRQDTAPATRADARPRRARQDIPPALRRAVLARDRHCRVPGCSHATFLDIHHIQPLSEGGRHEAANLLGICSAHHRATHRGELLIERDRDGTLTFRHADGSPYGAPTAPRAIDAHTKVFAALRHLGFREGEVKAVLAELRSDVALANAPVERLLREALCRIRPRPR